MWMARLPKGKIAHDANLEMLLTMFAETILNQLVQSPDRGNHLEKTQ